MIPRLLFILKQNETSYGGYGTSGGHLSSGLSNSVTFLVDMLTRHGVKAKMVIVPDNNSIDREVNSFKPTHVFIEAFWVVPEKFDVLKPLHRTVRWIVRNHSEIPFLSNEGIAIGWTIEYLKRGVEVMSNSLRAQEDLRAIAVAAGLPEQLVTFGPNFYPSPSPEHIGRPSRENARAIDIACFGAIRPLKNQLIQAIAAIALGDAVDMPVRFHINSSRVEGNASPVLKNIHELFARTIRSELVEHDWLSHKDFLQLIGSMNIAMQVSFSETFNIVSADAMAGSVPLVVSPDIPWIGAYAHADPTSLHSIVGRMMMIWNESAQDSHVRIHQQRRDLSAYCRASEQVWTRRFAATFGSAHQGRMSLV